MATTFKHLKDRGFVRISVKETGPVPVAMRKAHRLAQKKTYFQDAEFHHAENTPKRFTEAGGIELGFSNRTSKYEKRKRSLKDHNRPNVWSGETEKRAKETSSSATGSGNKMRYNVQALNFHPRYMKEWRRGSDREASKIADEHAKNFDANIQELT